MNTINQVEFEKTLKKFNVLKNEEINYFDDILKSIQYLDLLYKTNQRIPDIYDLLENKISTIKSLHDNSYLYLTDIYNDYVEAFGESKAIMDTIDVNGGIKTNE